MRPSAAWAPWLITLPAALLAELRMSSSGERLTVTGAVENGT
jgi:hypothetical protein